jgi:tetratricopeptide (TPR) repeat protein
MRAEAARAQGYDAYRSGDFARAREHFARALDLAREAKGAAHPGTLMALSDLAAAHFALGNHDAARAAHQDALRGRRLVLGDDHPDVAASLHNLGGVHRAQGALEAAEACHREAVTIWCRALGDAHPMVARGVASLAGLARARGQAREAVALAERALAIRVAALPEGDPAIVASLDELGMARAQAGDLAEAIAAWESAIAHLGAADGARVARLHLKAGVARRRLGDLDAAVSSFDAALTADGSLNAARHHLAAALIRLGRNAEAAPVRAAALRQQSVFVQAAASAPRLLILATAEEGNIPLEHVLPEHAYTRIWWFIDHARDPATETLPPYDAVFNGVGDADGSAAADVKIAEFLRVCRKQVLNDPARVAATRRDRLPELLGGIEGLTAPRVLRLEGFPDKAAVRLAAVDFGLPVLIRPAGAHGGVGVVRIGDWDALDGDVLGANAAWYLSRFQDCRSADGYFRKYRIVFVGGEPLPYHLAISSNWLVHYATSDMHAHDWKLQEEAAFLDDPRGALGSAAYAALEEAGRRLGLEYGGVDFTILSDGGVFVFEANPTMLVHPEREDGVLAFKNRAVQRIVQALQDLVHRRIALG